jgi:aconitase B
MGCPQNNRSKNLFTSRQASTSAWSPLFIVKKDGAAIYKYLNFNQIDEYVENAKGVTA